MNQRAISFLVFVVILINPSVDGLKVLGLFSHPGFSHLQMYEPIMKGLAAAGHNVTVISHSRENNTLPNYRSIGIHGMEILKNVVDIEVSIILSSLGMHSYVYCGAAGLCSSTVLHFHEGIPVLVSKRLGDLRSCARIRSDPKSH